MVVTTALFTLAGRGPGEERDVQVVTGLRLLHPSHGDCGAHRAVSEQEKMRQRCKSGCHVDIDMLGILSI